LSFLHPLGDEIGRAYVVFGKADTGAVALSEVAAGKGGFLLTGEARYDLTGASVSGGVDMNGDGLDDVMVGAPGSDIDGHSSGRTYVVYGRADTEAVDLADVAAGRGGFVLDGVRSSDYSAGSVSGAADVNGDGVPDVVIGARGPDTQSADSEIDPRPGRAYVFFGGDFSCPVEETGTGT